jgi:hypothetical protein
MTKAADRANVMLTPSAGTTATTTSLTSVASGLVSFPGVERETAKPSRDIEGAVYSFVRALRATGRTKVSPSEIAAALSLPPTEVMTALRALEKKGVKIPA